MIAAIEKAAIEKEYKIFFYCAFSIAAAAAAGRSGCRSHAAFVAAAVVLWRNRSAFIRPALKQPHFALNCFRNPNSHKRSHNTSNSENVNILFYVFVFQEIK